MARGLSHIARGCSMSRMEYDRVAQSDDCKFSAYSLEFNSSCVRLVYFLSDHVRGLNGYETSGKPGPPYAELAHPKIRIQGTHLWLWISMVFKRLFLIEIQ